MRVSLSPNANIIAALLFLTGMSLPACAQTPDDLLLDVKDVSAPDSPIKLAAGRVSFKQEIHSYRVNSAIARHLELANVSSKTILAYEVSFYAIPLYGGALLRVDRRDMFFTEKLTFVPGFRESLDDDWPESREQGSGEGPTIPKKYTGTPKAELKVVFVEFDDGSTYGTSDWGKHLSEGRAATIGWIVEFIHAFESGGDGELRTTLTKALALPEDLEITRDYLRMFDYNLKSDGAGKLIAKTKDRLRAAQEHVNMM